MLASSVLAAHGKLGAALGSGKKPGQLHLTQARRHGRLAVGVGWAVNEIAAFKPEQAGDLKVRGLAIKLALQKKNIGCKDLAGVSAEGEEGGGGVTWRRGDSESGVGGGGGTEGVREEECGAGRSGSSGSMPARGRARVRGQRGQEGEGGERPPRTASRCRRSLLASSRGWWPRDRCSSQRRAAGEEARGLGRAPQLAIGCVAD